MPMVKIQGRGQITLPKNVRKRLGCKPGDTLIIDDTRPGVAELRVFHPMTLEETFEKWHIEGPIDWHTLREEAEAEEADRRMKQWFGDDWDSRH